MAPGRSSLLRPGPAAVNTHGGPQRAVAGLGVALVPLPPPPLSPPDVGCAHTLLAVPTAAECIRIICPRDGGGEEGLYGPN